MARLGEANGLSQREIAQATAKSEDEISKTLSLLDLDPAVQKLARDDTTGHVTKRHLYAVRQLPPDRQQKLIAKIQSQGITADEAEKIASKEKERLEGRARPGAPFSCHRFRTTQATVSLTFRRKDTGREDILRALDEVREQLEERRDEAA